jgi:thymidylate synthase (FAD)
MTVTLIHVTPEAEKLVAKMARVSNPGNQHNDDTAPRLLAYLIKHRHWSPFEMVSLCVQIETQRDIAAQILRHRSFSFQEFSTRYAETRIADIPALRRQDTKNRQNSFDDIPQERQNELMDTVAESVLAAYRAYQKLLDEGVAKECARRVLPLCTPTTMYMHGTLRSWIHYLQVRTAPDTQLEHRQVALQCLEIFKEQFPFIYEAAFTEGILR